MRRRVNFRPSLETKPASGGERVREESVPTDDDALGELVREIFDITAAPYWEDRALTIRELVAQAIREAVAQAYEEAAMLSCNCFALEMDGHTRECSTTKIRALKDSLNTPGRDGVIMKAKQ